MDARQGEFEAWAVSRGLSLDKHPDNCPAFVGGVYRSARTRYAYGAWQARPTGGAEAMREACAKVCDGFADDRECASVGATLAADKIRALPLPACDGVEAKRKRCVDVCRGIAQQIEDHGEETHRAGDACILIANMVAEVGEALLEAERGRDA